MNKTMKIFCLVTFIILISIGPNCWCFPIDLEGEDGIITQEDILKFIESWHSTPDDPNWNPLADVNGDNIIDANDFNYLSEGYQNETPINTPTEEPTSISTPTETSLITPTFTPTLLEPTLTETIANTITPTVTFIIPTDPTFTVTPTITETLIPTSTNTPQPTTTDTPQPTSTETPTATSTSTSTVTETPASNTPTPLTDPEITIMLPGDVPLEMVRIPAGSFLMGASDSDDWAYSSEKPQHEVNIEYDFYMGKFEITQKQWLAVMGSWPIPVSVPSSAYGLGDNYPAYYLGWDDCKNFVTEINKLGQGTFRLPSEAEWEYSCRGGTTTRYYFGDSNCSLESCTTCDLDSYAWWCGNNSTYGNKEVGQLLPNDFGLYDMLGNVSEWCEDDWYAYDTKAPADGSARLDGKKGFFKVHRGGTWGSYAEFCSSTYRSEYATIITFNHLGFRIVRDQ